MSGDPLPPMEGLVMSRGFLRDGLDEHNTNMRSRTPMVSDVGHMVECNRRALRSSGFPRKSRFFDTSKKVEKSVASANFPT
jgi:hypothetical protein